MQKDGNASPPVRDFPGMIVYYPPVEWQGLFQRPQHLAVHLARQCSSFFYVQPAGLRNPALRDMARLRNLFFVRRDAQGRSVAGSNLHVKRLPFLPFHGLAAVEKYNSLVFSCFFRSKAAACPGKRILWTGAPAPFLRHAVRAARPDLLVFDWMDDYALFRHLPRAVVEMQDWLVKRADLVFASSGRLFQRAVALRGEYGVSLAPNGVDLDHWASASFPRHGGRQPWPPGRPVVGYFGTISHWMDAGLVEQVARLLPGCTFVFVGPRDDAGRMDRVFCLDNCLHIPASSYEKLPGIAGGFDLCWLPFREDSAVQAVNPVKIYEYLAMGKPVVSIPLPDIMQFSKVVAFARGAASFAAAISRALANAGNSHAVTQRVDAVRPYSWQAIAGGVAEALAALG